MDNIKSKTIKLVTPVGTRFRYSYLVTPDEYMGEQNIGRREKLNKISK